MSDAFEKFAPEESAEDYLEREGTPKPNGEDALVLDPADPLPSARRFLADGFTRLERRTLHHHRGGFYAWDGTAYYELDEPTLRGRVWAFLEQAERETGGELQPFKPTVPKVANVFDALKAAANLPASIAPPAWLDGAVDKPAAKELVACRNGLLHLPSGELLPPDPSFFGLNAVAFDYDPDAGDPVEWLRFLDSVWEDDQECRDTLQEFFGQALAGDTSQQKIILSVGPIRSGKGTIGRTLRAMLGDHNVCAPTLSSLTTNFGVQPLIGKQLAIVSDARLGYRSNLESVAERLLSISGEDALTVDRKYREPWTGQLPTQFLILTNELPRLIDPSGALISRFILLLFTESFYGREDLGLFNRLLGELPGILNWSIAGWARLRERGHYTQPASGRDAVQELEDLASPVKAFVRDRCNVGPSLSVERGALFTAWAVWCEANNYKVGGAATFGKNLRAAVRELKTSQPRGDGERHRYYEGIDLENN